MKAKLDEELAIIAKTSKVQDIKPMLFKKGDTVRVMNQPTKQELKDRIANADACNVRLLTELKKLDRQLIAEKAMSKLATLAAYACLAVIFIMVGVSVIW